MFYLTREAKTILAYENIVPRKPFYYVGLDETEVVTSRPKPEEKVK
jgi:hypothetical protein